MTSSEDPTRYLGARMAKSFLGELYRGTVAGHFDEDNQVFWHVDYDDGDEEDFDVHGLRKAITLHKRSASAMDLIPLPPLRRIFQYLSLEEVYALLRPVCRAFKRVCDEDPRWLPVIAPPSLAHVPLSLEEHGPQLRKLFVEYLDWLDRWHDLDANEKKGRGEQTGVAAAELKRMCSHLDGYFSLAPWTQHVSASYPTPWLHRMVYGQDCPSTHQSSPQRHPTIKPDDRSDFFQRRRRDEETLDRIFYTSIISPEDVYTPPQEKRRIILQPIDFRWENGAKHGRIPDHPEGELANLMDAAVKLLGCYFGHEDIISQELLVCRTNLQCSPEGYCRSDSLECANGDGEFIDRTVGQVAAESLHGLAPSVIADIATTYGPLPRGGKDVIIYIIAPHLFCKRSTFNWLFSCGLEETDSFQSYVVSTYMFREYDQSRRKLWHKHVMSSILCCALFGIETFHVCENSACVLNNSDGINEAKKDSHLTLCPACIRKLQFAGVLGDDIPAFHRRLYRLLTQEPFAHMCGGKEEEIHNLVLYQPSLGRPASHRREANAPGNKRNANAPGNKRKAKNMAFTSEAQRGAKKKKSATKLQRNLSILQAENKRLNNEKAKWKTERRRLLQYNSEKAYKIERLDAEREQVVSSTAKLQRDLTGLQAENERLSNEKAKWVNERCCLLKDISEKTHKIERLVAAAAMERERVVSSTAKLQRDLTGLQAESERLNNEKAKWVNERCCLQKDISEKTHKIERLVAAAAMERERVVSSTAKLQSDLTGLQAEHERLSHEKAKWERKCGSLQEDCIDKGNHIERIQSIRRQQQEDNRKLNGVCIAKDEEMSTLKAENQTLKKKLREYKKVAKAGGKKQKKREVLDEKLPDELKGLEKDLVEKIENQKIVPSGKGVSFRDVAGLANVKTILRETLIFPMKRPDMFTGLREAPKGLLLFGPPGTGKTLIGKAIAHESGATFFSISCSDLTSKWEGEGEKLVKTLFAVASYRAPSVIFMDEVDSLLTQRKSDESEAGRRIKTEFLAQLDGAGKGRQGRVLFIGATNLPQELDGAARRRFVKRVYIPLPTRASRECLVQHLLVRETHSLTGEQISKLCRKTDGFSGADLKELCKDAALGPMRQVGLDAAMTMNTADLPPISFEHFCDSLLNMSPSVASADLTACELWNDRFGSNVNKSVAKEVP